MEPSISLISEKHTDPSSSSSSSQNGQSSSPELAHTSHNGSSMNGSTELHKHQDLEVEEVKVDRSSSILPPTTSLYNPLETLAVAWHVYSLPIILSAFLLSCSFPPFWPFIFAYLVRYLITKYEFIIVIIKIIIIIINFFFFKFFFNFNNFTYILRFSLLLIKGPKMDRVQIGHP